MHDLLAAALLLAQGEPIGWTGDAVAKVGLGVASFLSLVSGGGYLGKRLLDELKAQREGFLVALEKQHQDHSAEMAKIVEHNSRQVAGLHGAIDKLGEEIRYSTGDRRSNSGNGGAIR